MCRMPKGISDFKLIRKENYVFIDTRSALCETDYIEKLENANRYIHFLRPHQRRGASVRRRKYNGWKSHLVRFSQSLVSSPWSDNGNIII